MKKKDLSTLINGVQYIKYSQVAYLILILLPVLLIPLVLLNVFANTLVGTIFFILGFVFVVMKITFFVFLFKGFRAMNNIKTEGLSAKTKKGYKAMLTYGAILLVWWLTTTIADITFLEMIWSYLSSILLLIVSIFIIKILDDENVNNEENKGIHYYIYFLLAYETANYLGQQFLGYGFNYTYNNFTYELGGVLYLVVSIYILIKANLYLDKAEHPQFRA